MRHLSGLLYLALLPLCWAALPTPASAHPHSFVEAYVTIVFDQDGLAGIRQRWVIDEMTAFSVLDLIAENGDGELSPAEVAAIKAQSMGSLRDYGFFTDIRIDGKRFKPDWIRDFKAELKGAKLIYDFTLPCHVKASNQFKKITVAVYDESFYAYVSYAVEDKPAIDPTKDPKFRDLTAGPSPDDYQRFADSVGLEAYSGEVRLGGPLERFDIRAEVDEVPEMAYYQGQIVPEAFIIRFKAK